MGPSPAFETVELDELTITVVADNASDTLSSVAPGIPQIPEMAHLLEGPVIGTYDGHDMVVTLDRMCVACHGLSAIAAARGVGRSATVLSDVGPYGDVWLANAQRLGIDLSGIDVRSASDPPSRVWPTSSRRGSSRPATAPAGGPRPPWQRPSVRPASRRASSGPATHSLVCPERRDRTAAHPHLAVVAKASVSSAEGTK
jgi:hypothetical protein